MRKIAFIILGYNQNKKNVPAFGKIESFFQAKNFQTVMVDIDWKYKTLSDYVAQFEKIYLENVKKDDQICFLGFSLGAMIALISSEKLKPKFQILCSLSPYFKEDLPRIKNWWKVFWGKRRMEDFAKFSLNKLAKNIPTKTIILAGDKEDWEVEIRAKEARQKIRNSQLIFIPNAKHDIGQTEYLTEVERIISEKVF